MKRRTFIKGLLATGALVWVQPEAMLKITPPALVGDGKTDDTAAIQAILDKGYGYLPPGHYLITDTLRIEKSRTAIMGSVFKCGKDVETWLYVKDHVSDVTICNNIIQYSPWPTV